MPIGLFMCLSGKSIFVVILTLKFNLIFSHRTKPSASDFFRFCTSNASARLQFLGISFFAGIDDNLFGREFSANLFYLFADLFSSKHAIYDKDTDHQIVE